MIDDRMFDFKNFYERVANQLPNNCIVVEVGNADGASALYLADRLHSLGKSFKMYLVDNMGYGGYQQMNTLWRNVHESGLADYIEIIPKDSIEASKDFNGNSLDMVFIDSSHQYESTKQEIVAWYDKIKDEGIFAGHDATSEENKGVGRAIKEMLPEIIKRPDINEPDHQQEFQPHNFLMIHETDNGHGVWEVQKNFYWQPAMPFKWRECYAAFVNLIHRTDRLERMTAELNRVGIEAERFEAIHTIDESWNRYPYQKMFQRSRGAIGCALSQLGVMKKAYEKGLGVIVLEDDLVIGSDATQRLDYIDNFINVKEPDADLIFLGGTVHCNPSWWHSKEHEPMLKPYCNCTLERDMERIDDEHMVRTYGMFSTHAYMIPYKKIPKIIELIESVMEITIGIDFSLIIHQPNLKCFAYLGGIIKQYNAVSDIGNGAITYFENFSKLNGSEENSKYWWVDFTDQFNPNEFNWAEAHKR